MGYDESWEEWSSSDKWICHRCVSDDILQDLLQAEEEEAECSFCDSQNAAKFDVLLEALNEAIARDYTDPANELPYESAEGGYQGTVYDGSEIVYELDQWTENDKVLEEASSCFAGSAWCDRDFFSLRPLETYKFGWEGFVQLVKHRTRYLFLRDSGEEERHDEIPPSRMLSAIGLVLENHASFITIAANSEIFRARVHPEDQDLSTAAELGAPPTEYALLPNRMSPAGVSMFYGALDRDTAVAETFDWSRALGVAITIGTFEPTRSLTLLDLTHGVDVPSQFDEENYHLRAPIAFLGGFIRDFVRPVKRNGSEHVQYVPTQVVTEYVRYEMKAGEDTPIDGIMYSSSRHHGGCSMVLFADAADCGPRPRPAWNTNPYLLTLKEARKYSPADFIHLKDGA